MSDELSENIEELPEWARKRISRLQEVVDAVIWATSDMSLSTRTPCREKSTRTLDSPELIDAHVEIQRLRDGLSAIAKMGLSADETTLYGLGFGRGCRSVQYHIEKFLAAGKGETESQ